MNFVLKSMTDYTKDGKVNYRAFFSQFIPKELSSHDKERLKEIDDSAMDKRINKILKKLKNTIDKQGIKMKDVFKKFDTDGDHNIDKDEFSKAFESMGFKLSDDEI